MVICLERGADLHMAQLMPLPLTVSCFSKIHIGFTFLVLDQLDSPRKWLLNGRVCVCVCACQNKMVSSVILTWQYWSLQDYQTDETYDKPGIHILLNDITRRHNSTASQ